jgi:hypothetical protein
MSHFHTQLSSQLLVLAENDDLASAANVIQVQLIGPTITEMPPVTYYNYTLLARLKIEVDPTFLYRQTSLHGLIANTFGDILCRQTDVALTPRLGCLMRLTPIKVTPLGDRKDRGKLVNLSTISAEYEIQLEDS